MKLPLFQGGFTVEAAEEIAGASLRTLTSLVDRSLLWHDVSAGRLDMHKLLREFAEDKLRQVGQADAVREAHSAYHLDLLCRLGEDVKGGDRQVEALEAIDADIENIRAAWDWALKNQAYERVKEAADVLYRVLSFRRRLEEGAQLFRRAANALESRADEDSRRLLGPVRARQAMLAAGYLSNEDAIHLLERSLESARRYDMPAERAFCLRGIGEALLDLEGPRTAKPVLEESLAIASAIDARWIQIPVLVALHDVAMLEGKPGEANRLARQLLTVCRETGDSISLSFASYRLGVSATSAAMKKGSAALRRVWPFASSSKTLHESVTLELPWPYMQRV